MALVPIVPPTSGQLYPQKGVVQFSWQTFVNAGDVGDVVSVLRFQQKTVQIIGSLGTSPSIQIEGSNDGGTTWSVLVDDANAPLVFTTGLPVMKAISDALCPLLIRPNLTASTGASSVNVWFSGVAVAS